MDVCSSCRWPTGALLRLEDDGFVVHADLAGVCPGNCNDMVVDARGNAYVGNIGFPYGYRGAPVPVRSATSLVLVTPDGDVRPQPGTLMCPNGAVISADGSTLVVAQSHMGRLTAYEIGDDGSLHGERVFADLPAGRNNPDGICIDAEGAVWVADPHHRCCMRVLDGGQLTHVVDTAPFECVACMLGGPDLCTLFLVLVEPRDAPGARELRDRRTRRPVRHVARRGARGRGARRRLAAMTAAQFWRMGATPVPATEIGRLARAFEDSGWDGLALGEAHGLLPDPYVLLGVAAQATTTLKLGTSVAVPLRHPLLAAGAMATVHALAMAAAAS